MWHLQTILRNKFLGTDDFFLEVLENVSEAELSWICSLSPNVTFSHLKVFVGMFEVEKVADLQHQKYAYGMSRLWLSSKSLAFSTKY